MHTQWWRSEKSHCITSGCILMYHTKSQFTSKLQVRTNVLSWWWSHILWVSGMVCFMFCEKYRFCNPNLSTLLTTNCGPWGQSNQDLPFKSLKDLSNVKELHDNKILITYGQNNFFILHIWISCTFLSFILLNTDIALSFHCEVCLKL